MRISVTRGEVPIRNVIVRSHLEGRLYQVTIATPLDKHALVALGGSVASAEGISHRVELYRARRRAGEFLPAVVTLASDSAREESALAGGLVEIDWNRWGVALIAIAPEVFESGHVVGSWEEYQSANEGGYPG